MNGEISSQTNKRRMGLAADLKSHCYHTNNTTYDPTIKKRRDFHGPGDYQKTIQSLSP